MNKNNVFATIAGISFALISTIVSSQPPSYWGVEFPTSGSAQAQQHFLAGVTSMHLHMFEDAEEHFRTAQALEPDFAMAYWGEALNNHRTIWSIHRYDAAREVLNRLGGNADERAAKAPTEREKEYLAAVEILFGEGPQTQRQAAYSRAMQALSERYPEDTEALAWYALSLMRETPPGMTRQRTRSLMASLSLEVLARNPRHPGANRYLIQSTDDPENTDLGVIAVNNLAMIETDAAEALHIPSHYFIQHGMWAETADANMKAFRSSMAWVEDHDWSLSDLNQHNYGHLIQFAHYGLLQSGQLAEARQLRERVYSDFLASDLADEIAAPLADTYARAIIDLENWHDATSLAELAKKHGLRQVAIWTAVGIGSVHNGDETLAREALAVLQDSAGGPSSQGAIAALEVEGLLYISNGNTTQGLDRIAEAVSRNLEQPVTTLGVPPRPLKPVLELYGEVLLDSGNAALALQQFQQGMTLYRGRTNLLLGAMHAAAALNQKETAQRYRQQLEKIWTIADQNHPFAGMIADNNE